jgi:hypothetical protein
MEEKDEWVFYKELDFNCPKNNRFNIDTRDFHAGYNFQTENHEDWELIKKYPHFFHTLEQLKQLLDRYFVDSGGADKEWRFFQLTGYGENWNLKYLRIYRTDLGFLICDNYHNALKSEILNQNVYNS